MIEYIGSEPIGETGRELMSIAKLRNDKNKAYYLLTIVDTKTTQIIAQTRLNSDHLKVFKKLVNDANLEGMKI